MLCSVLSCLFLVGQLGNRSNCLTDVDKKQLAAFIRAVAIEVSDVALKGKVGEQHWGVQLNTTGVASQVTATPDFPVVMAAIALPI